MDFAIRASGTGAKPCGNCEARASGNPRASPTGKVAANPHARPISVGEVECSQGKGGCATVKYSTQSRAVIWSWRIP